MILAWHLVWTTYGWWFPNDPRGSWSKEIWVPKLRGLAGPPAARSPGRKLVQPSRKELQQWLNIGQRRLKHEAVVLDSRAQDIASNAIMKQVQLHQYNLLALAVMPEHVHAVVTKHSHKYERIVNAFKSVSARELRKYFGLAASPATRAAGGPAKRSKRAPVWSRRYWVRYLDTQEAMETAIAYVKRQSHSV